MWAVTGRRGEWENWDECWSDVPAVHAYFPLRRQRDVQLHLARLARAVSAGRRLAPVSHLCRRVPDVPAGGRRRAGLRALSVRLRRQRADDRDSQRWRQKPKEHDQLASPGQWRNQN